MTEIIFTAEIVAYDPAIPGTRTLRYASGLGFATTPADTPANVYYEPRIIEPGNFARTLFSDTRVMGGGTIGYGELVLNNADQALSSLLDLGMDGRDVTIRLGPAGGAYPADHTVYLVGTIQSVEVGAARAILRLRDKLLLLGQPLQTQRYGGTNVLPAGVDGVAADIKGQVKPIMLGEVLGAAPVLVNTARLIYQLHAGAIDAVDAVYDQGVALTFGVNRASQAAMEATSPAAGTYDTCLSLGLIRLGATPAGRVTVDAAGAAAGGYVSTPAELVRKLLADYCGVATGDIDAASFAALAAAAPYDAGIYIASDTTRQAAIDALLESVGAWLIPTRLGVWQVGQLVAPAGTPAATFGDAELLAIDRVATRDAGGGVPAWQVTLRYGRQWTPLGPSDVAAGVSAARKAEVAQEWRSAVATDSAVLTTHLLATTLQRDTLLVDPVDAAAEADRVLQLHRVRRDYVQITVDWSAANATLDGGQVVRLLTPRLGYAAGRLLSVVGISSDGGRRTLTLDLWG